MRSMPDGLRAQDPGSGRKFAKEGDYVQSLNPALAEPSLTRISLRKWP